MFDPLNREFKFTLDPCCTVETAKCARFYTEADNGLVQSWAGERVFMNCPYGAEIYDWTAKVVAEVTGPKPAELVVGLLPASLDLEWWHRDVLGHACEVRCYRGRVRFLTGGPYRASGFFASVAIVWRAGVIVAAPVMTRALVDKVARHD